MGNLLNKIEQWVGGGPGGAKRIKTFRWLLLIGLIGLMAMLVQSFLTVQEINPLASDRASPESLKEQVFASSDPSEPNHIAEFESAYEMKLKEILEQIVGVGSVDVLVTLDSTEEQVFARNQQDTHSVTEEKDGSGGQRHITEISRNGTIEHIAGSDDAPPMVVKTIKPKVRGVLVVAKGAENLTVKKLLVEAVERGIDVPSHRISIVPRKQQ